MLENIQLGAWIISIIGWGSLLIFDPKIFLLKQVILVVIISASLGALVTSLIGIFGLEVLNA